MSRFPVVCVIGDPIAQSKSPRIHRYWLDKYGISGDYTRFLLEPAQLEPGLRHMVDLGFVGANITIPHKENVLQIADQVSDAARQIGAANTLLFQDGAIHADNTDGFGFMANLQQYSNWQPQRPVLVLGAGGAARAILYALAQANAPRIFLANRTRSRADDLAAHFGAPIEAIDWEAVADVLPQVGLVVNTTSLGMQGQPPLQIDLAPLNTAIVTDIVYAPLETEFLRQARALGHCAVDGLGMLLHQAVPGFERWFGHRPDVDEALRAEVLR